MDGEIKVRSQKQNKEKHFLGIIKTKKIVRKMTGTIEGNNYNSNWHGDKNHEETKKLNYQKRQYKSKIKRLKISKNLNLEKENKELLKYRKIVKLEIENQRREQKEKKTAERRTIELKRKRRKKLLKIREKRLREMIEIESDSEILNSLFRQNEYQDVNTNFINKENSDISEFNELNSKFNVKKTDGNLNKLSIGTKINNIPKKQSTTNVLDIKLGIKDDMFGSDFEEKSIVQYPILRRDKRDNKLLTDFDDTEGYYVSRMGDILFRRYSVFKEQGRGVFSSVLRVRDISMDNLECVIKIIRNNEIMYKAGPKEIQHLELSKTMDPEGKFYCVQLYDHFEIRNHLCLVFEPMKCNLRQLIKKVGAGSGFNLDSLRRYSIQLFKALLHMKQCEIIHADIKPDNILVSENNRTVKICDLGSAMKPDDIEITEILGSRYYRAPEVMIGLMFLYPIDMWAMACVLYECYTGKILYKGNPDNNKMLLFHQKVMGRYPVKVGKKGAFWTRHFGFEGDYTENKEDPVTKMEIKLKHKFIENSSKNMQHLLDPNNLYEKKMNEIERIKFINFRDLLVRMMHLDDSKRIVPILGLKHPFLYRKKRKNK